MINAEARSNRRARRRLIGFSEFDMCQEWFVSLLSAPRELDDRYNKKSIYHTTGKEIHRVIGLGQRACAYSNALERRQVGL